MFASDGAAAVEQALKIAFQYWTNRAAAAGEDPRATARTTYLALGHAYHGDTVGAISLGAGRLRHRRVRSAPLPGAAGARLRRPGLGRRRHRAARRAPRAAWPRWCIEPLVQGAAGMLVTDPGSVRRVVEAAQAHGVLVIADEVATGFGRTGTLFACEQCGVQPDLLVIGKGLTGGYLPLSATAASRRVYDAFLGPDLSEATFYHGHSYSGNALACAVALRHLELLDEWDVLANVVARVGAARRPAGRADRTAARRWPRCGARGLMVGVELDPPADGLRWGRRVCAGGGGQGGAAATTRRCGGLDAHAHVHHRRDRPHRVRAGRRHRGR